MIKLRYDSRDKIFHQRFGSVAEPLPAELNLDTLFYDEVQPLGDVKCVSYTTHDIAEDQQQIEFDIRSIEDLWARVPSNPRGSDPRDVLKEAVAGGLLPKGKNERLKAWRSFWRGDLGPADAFDNVRSTLMLTKCPIGAGTYWYREWQGEILPLGRTPTNGHMYSIEGWKQINGEPHLIIEAWLGRKCYMPRATFNAAMKPYGMQCWVLSTAELDNRRVKSLTEKIKDLMINLIIKLRDAIKTKDAEPIVPAPIIPVEPPPQPEPEPAGSHLLKWAEGIKIFEDYVPPGARYRSGKIAPAGSLSWRNRNPGNLKNLSGAFMSFKTHEAGWQALLDYLTRAATGRHKAYKPEFSLLQFFRIYAPDTDANEPVIYAGFVAHHIGVPTETKIKNLI